MAVLGEACQCRNSKEASLSFETEDIQQKTGQTVTSEDIRQSVLFLPALLFCHPPASLHHLGGIKHTSLIVRKRVYVCVLNLLFPSHAQKQKNFSLSAHFSFPTFSFSSHTMSR